jgi:hypothetical protein
MESFPGQNRVKSNNIKYFLRPLMLGILTNILVSVALPRLFSPGEISQQLPFPHAPLRAMPDGNRPKYLVFPARHFKQKITEKWTQGKCPRAARCKE